MIRRLKNGFLDMLYALGVRLRALRRRLRRGAPPPAPVLRGNMRTVLVVQPEGEIFREAIFILRDDYFQTPGVSREALMRQAREAARGYLEAR